MPTVLLDTCAVIWIGNGNPLREPALSFFEKEPNVQFLVSPITAWEIAMLESKCRITLAVDTEAWFALFCGKPNVELTELSPRILIRSTELPGNPPADPIDRIILATARELGHTLVTRDRHLLNYGASGLVRTLGC